MKLMIASDVHGSALYCGQMLEAYQREEADRLLLLGDILYHGPRNRLPEEYARAETALMFREWLAERSLPLMCVRGNCDAEVDQMVLEFPILSDSMVLFLNGRMAFVTHGHLFNTQNPPPLNRGDLLIHGHTHVQAFTPFGNDNLYINPGSTSIPKENNEHSYMTYEDGLFTIKTMNGQEICSRRI